MKHCALFLALLVAGFVAAKGFAGAFPDGPNGPVIAVVNASPLTDKAVTDALPTMQLYESQVCAAWHCSGTLYFAGHATKPDCSATKLEHASDWLVCLNGTSDVAGAVGYHIEGNGKILSYVSTQTARQYGMGWMAVLTHELGEMLVDPEAESTENTACEYTYGPSGQPVPSNCTFYMKEIADPVQGKSYWLGNYRASDFVYRSWFEPDSPGPYDASRVLKAPLTLYKQSYLSVYKDGGWDQPNTFKTSRNWDGFGSFVGPSDPRCC